MRRNYYWSLFFVSTSTIALEVALLRYFSVTSWQAFGSMVIGIALIGFAISGTALTLFKDFFKKNVEQKLLTTLFLYLLTIPLSFLAANTVPFNPNKMLNNGAILGEVLHLTEYFLFFFVPFFFAGLFTGLSFLRHHDTIGKIYFFDLVGAGTGSMLVLLAMFFIPPLALPSFVFLLAFLAFLLVLRNATVSLLSRGLLLASVAAAFVGFLFWNKADYQPYKPISQAQLIAGNKSLLPRPLLSPIGIMDVFSNASEKATLPLSDEFSNLVPDGKIPDIYPGFYLDGNRVDGLVKAGQDTRYIDYNLYAAPFQLENHPSVLIIGSGGGFGVYQAVTLGAKHVEVVEPNPFLIHLLKHQFSTLNDGLFNRPDVGVLINDGRSFFLRDHSRYDLLQISDVAIATKTDENYLLTKEAFADYSHLLKPNGILTVSMDISDNFFYALRLLSTLAAYQRDHQIDPAQHTVILRSLFKMLFLVKKSPFTPDEIAKLRQFSSTLGFDAVYFPGVTGTESIFNLAPYIPVTTHDRGKAEIGQEPILKDDQFYQLATSILDGHSTLKDGIFDYRPSTDDRPYFFSLLSPEKIFSALKTYDLGGLPQQEIGSLILYAEFINVVFFALLIVLIPVVARLLQRQKHHIGAVFFGKSLIYFACLGLGFLFIEIVLIQKLALFLGEVIYSFTLVLASILVFAGVGSFLSERVTQHPARVIRIAALGIVLGVLFMIFVLPSWIRFFGTAPFGIRLLLSFVFVAPLAIPLGFFFPLGLGELTGTRKDFVPWAWSINGAFSVVATVSARLLSQSFGFSTVLSLAALLYLLAALTFPQNRTEGTLKNQN
jgi:hypothetical protein